MFLPQNHPASNLHKIHLWSYPPPEIKLPIFLNTCLWKITCKFSKKKNPQAFTFGKKKNVGVRKPGFKDMCSPSEQLENASFHSWTALFLVNHISICVSLRAAESHKDPQSPAKFTCDLKTIITDGEHLLFSHWGFPAHSSFLLSYCFFPSTKRKYWLSFSYIKHSQQEWKWFLEDGQKKKYSLVYNVQIMYNVQGLPW